ncbi:hypothetical protein VCRA2123O444_250053 [Vibrio crassostreae]|uniref:hypothetical protein n=1 Tax=Vibrio crassostreae TaxID=246167 RepID=UPI001B3184BF|nr:hypothetical protein [Vibrio crassostreae]CAK1907040.1 hypothetical protein VCRA2113O416_220053 [Vibrio crassostreae]CAK1914058.1 hypothetical protein VCRA2118O429_220054 [Vibrio crassostreae]CAK1915689.1 hypothetical protein VCRA2117O428_230053 [Vibrio crassostreae]CAK1916991.1 hypothetical protein VCRA2119O432_230036 [Vibrio crassostreae]CAK1918870.1 hypothetical protein VCRA2113O413_230053 [Vibrio crassostreae]
MKILMSVLVIFFVVGCSGSGGDAVVHGDGDATAGSGVVVSGSGNPTVEADVEVKPL